MFQPITINKFQGLNSAVAPELIEVGEARDIYNFRHEKLGKLVSRNGYVYGLFTKSDNVSFLEPASEDYPNYVNDPVNAGTTSRYHDAEVPYIFNKGFIGIGEYILDGQIEYLDTDRFMVYVCRSKIESATYTNDDQYSQCYLIAPLTGKYKDFLFNAGVTETDKLGWIGTNPTYIYERDQTAQGVIDEGRDELVAPAIPFLDYEYKNNLMRGAFKSTEWIDSFVKINQYRHQLVISDRTNGDTLIEDEYSLRTGQECDPVEHSLRIRPNSLDSFDIDVVNFDLRLDTDEENALDGDGVETAMALYQFEVEKDVFKNTVDYFEGSPSDGDTYADIEFATEIIQTDQLVDAYNNTIPGYISSVVDKFYQTKQMSAVPLHIRQILPSWTQNLVANPDHRDIHYVTGTDLATDGTPILRYEYNTAKNYRFTNKRDIEEYSNILSAVRLKKTDTVDEEGNAIDSYSSGVYLWQKLKLPYKPIKSKTGLYYLQTAEDKEYDRTIAGQPRIIEFETQEGFSKQVPLTGWQYRFVWDYGNGILSAPSTEIKAPDLLWSAYSEANLGRVNIESDQIEQTLKKIQNGASQRGDVIGDLPALLENDLSLTDFGYTVWKFKNGLYFSEHLFGGQTDADSRATVDSFFQDTDNQEKAENFGTFLTCVGAETVTMDGYFCEGITVLCPSIINLGTDLKLKVEQSWQYAVHLRATDDYNKEKPLLKYLDAAPFIITSRLPLYIPLVPRIGNSASYNSVFDYKGKLRTGYLNANTITTNYTKTLPETGTTDFLYQNKVANKQLILTGYNSGINFHVDNVYNFDLGDIMSIDAATFSVGSDTQVNPYVMMIADLWGTVIFSFIGRGYNVVDFTTPREIKLKGFSPASDARDLGFSMPNWGNFVCSEAILSNYAKRTDNGIYLNIVCENDDDNNSNLASEERIATLLRYANQEGDRLLSFRPDVPAEVVNRVVLAGHLPINLLSPNEEFFWQSQYQLIRGKDIVSAPTEAEQNALFNKRIEDSLAYDKSRYPYKLQNAVHPVTIGELQSSGQFIEPMDYDGREIQNGSALFQDDWNEYTTNNIEAIIYLEGERLLAYEQLTSIVPSSLLFNAPRLGVTIAENKIPRRAKKLRIYRTITTADNSFDPNSYGLVEEVAISTATEVITAENGSVAIGEKYTVTEDGKKYKGIYYFDEVKDANLDFNFDINESEGLRKPIQSRFNMPLNERMYYANFIQKYRPESPRLHQSKDAIGEEVDVVSIEKAYNTHYHVFGYNTALPTGEETAKYYDRDDKEYVRYAYAYEDVNGIISEIKYTGVIDPTLDARESTVATYDYGQVVLFYLPNSYNGSIKHLNVYRTTYVLPGTRDTIATDYAAAVAVMTADNYTDTHKYYKIAEIDEKDMGILHDTKLPDKEEMGCDHEVVEDYESGVMFSEAYRPDFIKAESLLEYRSGDGDQITGLASLYGNLIVAKENSLHRITVQMEDATVSRVDELTPDVGCIAPETFMTVDNDLYFVSNQGIMTYNNNAIVPIDEKINEEIRTYLRMLKEYPDPVVGNLAHYITAGYNPEFRELYFNFPQLVYPTVGPTAANQFQNAGNYATNFYQYARQFEAHIYVYNLDKKYWTKFAYSQELIDENWNRGIELDPEEEYNDHYIKKVEHALVNSRLYFTNSIGEMRSADIMTTQYAVGPNMILDGTIITPTTTDWEGHEWAGAYTETPNNPPLPGRTYSGISNITTVDSYLSTDDMPNPILLHSGFQDGVNPAPNPPEEWDTARTFPPRVGVPIKVKYKSHFITLDSETIMKRVNRVVGNVYSEDDFTVRLLVQNKTSSDERISNNYPTHTFTYAPTQVTAESNRHPLTGIIRGSAVIDNNIITAIPTPAVALDPDNDDYTLDDTNLKGIRFSIELESSMRTQINEFVLFVRPIHVLNNYTRVGN